MRRASFRFHSGKQADNPANDRLTDQGRQQAQTAADRLAGASLTAVIAAPEVRTRDTAAAVTQRAKLPSAAVDGSFTSKAFEGEGPAQRGDRGIAALRRFLANTKGNVAVVAHGHIIHLMAATLTGQALTPDVVKYELVPGGITQLSVTRDASGNEKWQKVGSDALVRDN